MRCRAHTARKPTVAAGYPLTTAEVLSQVNGALGSLDRPTMIALSQLLDAYNNAGGCPLH